MFEYFGLRCTNESKAQKKKKNSEPWFNDSIRSLRQICRRYERKWLKDKLQISYDLLRDSLSHFQKAVKLAKSKYLSEIINNSHCPRTIFSTIDNVLNPTVDVFVDVSETLCKNFLTFFVEKVDRLRSQVLQSVSDIIERPWSSAKWSNFQPVTISACKDIIEHLRPTVCPYDVMPARFLKHFKARFLCSVVLLFTLLCKALWSTLSCV